MSCVLFIDSSDRDRIALKLVEQGSIVATLERQSRDGHSVTITPTIQTLFRRAKRNPTDISGVAVVEGPGPFTAVRVGVVVANALAWSLGVPVQGITQSEFEHGATRKQKTKKWKPIMPVYGAEPNITIARL